jgi:hypothetical protein
MKPRREHTEMEPQTGIEPAYHPWQGRILAIELLGQMEGSR